MNDVSFIKPGTGNRVEIGFRRPINPKLRGLSKLAQEFILMLLRTPGFDSFQPDLGGGLRAIGGVQDEQRIKEVVRGVVDKTISNVRSVQIGQGLPTNERLLTATVVNVKFLQNNFLAVELRITSESDESAFVDVRV